MEESGQLMLSWRESLLFTSSTKRRCFLLRCLPQSCAQHPWECKHSKLEDREAPRLPCPQWSLQNKHLQVGFSPRLLVRLMDDLAYSFPSAPVALIRPTSMPNVHSEPVPVSSPQKLAAPVFPGHLPPILVHTSMWYKWRWQKTMRGVATTAGSQGIQTLRRSSPGSWCTSRSARKRYCPCGLSQAGPHPLTWVSAKWL
jgi:hypothetical protein